VAAVSLACQPAAAPSKPTDAPAAEPTKPAAVPAAQPATSPAAAPAPAASPVAAAPAAAASPAAAPAPAAASPAAKPASAVPTLGPGPKISIQFVGQSLPVQLQASTVDVPYSKEIIPQRSNGRIEVTYATWSERNLQGNEIIRLVRQGQVEIGGAPLTYLAGDVPLLDAADLAGLNPTIEQARKVMDAITPTVNKDLERFGVRQIASFPFPAQVLWCRDPVKGLEDLKGKKVRTFGTSLPDLVTALGGQPVNVTFAESYTALERGVADCGITGTGSGNSAKWYEVTNHMYTLSVGWSVGAYYVNLDWLNKQPKDVQDFLLAVFKEMEDKQWELGKVQTQDGIDCSTGKAATCKLGTLDSSSPMTAVDASEADKTLLRKILEESVIPGWVKRCGERCGDSFNEAIAPVAGVKYVKR
jgi:TRAP-type C4-dicarboxylate transport system substrate-binding protein